MTKTKALTQVEKMKGIISADSVKKQFENALADSAPLFVASVIDLYGSDKYLQKCNPGDVIKEALKAAVLRLPINKSLGFAYVIPYKNQPQFQIGYKGLIQLAMRTGAYKYINADKLFEGELIKQDKLTGEIEIGQPTGKKVTNYFAFIETMNGFRKTICWTKEQVVEHAKRFSQSYNSKTSPWKTDFDAMAIKTVLKALLGKYGIMSIEMTQAFVSDSDPLKMKIDTEIAENANTELINLAPESPEPEQPKKETPKPGNVVDAEMPPDLEPTAEEKQAIIDAEIAESEQEPDFCK